MEIFTNLFAEISIVKKMCPRKDWNFFHVWCSAANIEIFEMSHRHEGAGGGVIGGGGQVERLLY